MTRNAPNPGIQIGVAKTSIYIAASGDGNNKYQKRQSRKLDLSNKKSSPEEKGPSKKVKLKKAENNY